MKLIEADAKKLLAEAGIRVPTGTLLALEVDAPSDTPAFPLFVKAQILSGRRGKRGLVQRASNQHELASTIAGMRTLLKDEPCAGFLLEPEVAFQELWLVSVDLDRSAGAMRATVSPSGGMDVSAARSVLIHSDADAMSLDAPKSVQDILIKLLALFRKSDALSMEINPLAIQADGSAVALDAKIELDDAASFRHAEWASLQLRKPIQLGGYVELDGDIALILSGGGASLVALDALFAAGGRAANYIEMSGNPDAESVRAASKNVLSKSGIRAIWIAGSFANFTDIRATVGAVFAAVDELGLRVPIVIRRDGPNAEAAQAEALRWGKEHGVTVRFDRAEVDLHVSAKAVVAAAQAYEP